MRGLRRVFGFVSLACALTGCDRYPAYVHAPAYVRNMTDTDLTIDVQVRGGARPAQGNIAAGEFDKLSAPPGEITSLAYRGNGVNCKLGRDDISAATFFNVQMGPIIGLQACRSSK